MQRKTSQRNAILDALRGAGRPMSAEDLTGLARTSVASLNRATVYRNLRLLIGAGRVRRLAHPELGPLYELADLDHHHHFHCRLCDRVFEIPGCALDVRIATPPGFRTDDHEVFLYGNCADCRG